MTFRQKSPLLRKPGRNGALVFLSNFFCGYFSGSRSTCYRLSAMRMMVLSLLFSLSLLHAQTVRTGEDVLRAMHDRYPGWYHTVTFTQKSTTYKADGTNSAETWYEALALPGKLRIDIGPASDGKGLVLVDGEMSTIRDNKVAETRRYVNMLLVLGFDVYGQDPQKTATVVKGEGFNLSKLREDTWEGKPAY